MSQTMRAANTNSNGVTARERQMMKAIVDHINAELAPLKKAVTEAAALRSEVEVLRAEVGNYRAAFGLVPVPDVRSASAPYRPRGRRA